MERQVDATNAVAVSDLEKLICPFMESNCTRKCSLFTGRGCALNYLTEIEDLKEEIRKLRSQDL